MTQHKPRSSRLYVAYDKTGAPIALVDATSVAQARAHLAINQWRIEYADQAALLAAYKAGLEPMKAGDSTEGGSDEQ